MKKEMILAVSVLLASAGLAMADGGKASYLTLDPAVATAEDAGAPTTPLMMGLDKIGAAKPLSSLNLNIYGFVDSGYTFNTDHHSGQFNVGRVFDAEIPNRYQLDQIDLTIERTIVDKKKFDVGGKIEMIYGTDARFTHSNGMEFGNGDVNSGTSPTLSPQYQFDLVQAYVDVNAPIGNGLNFRLGKFVTPMGFETINPTTNPFYSHSYLFNFAIPFTNTGALASYQLNDQVNLSAGVVRGWDQSLEDNNGSPSGIAGITYTPNKQWSVTVNAICGPENFGDTGHYRTGVDPVLIYTPTDKWTFTADADYTYDGGADAGTQADWYGVALYAGYAINDYVTANGRGEWFHDGDGVRLGTGTSTNVFEATLGLNIKPFPKDPWGSNLKIRPEARYDYCEDPIFVGGTDRNQVTLAVDLIVTF